MFDKPVIGPQGGRIRQLLYLVTFFSLVVAGNTLQAAENRVALVVGNAAYSGEPLANPSNDARDIGAKLQELGFDVDSAIDVSKEEFEQKVEDFGDRLKKADIGFFYYAGHGVQFYGENYLVPVTARLISEKAVQQDSVAVSKILGRMEQANNAVNIVVLDACRNNPFAMAEAGGDARGLQLARTRGLSPEASGEPAEKTGKGLSAVQAPTGSFIAYATAPGSVAADGSGRNGVYTKYLLETIDHPGLSIEQAFKQVRVGVIKETDGLQIPWESSSLLGDFVFKSPEAPSEQVAVAEPVIPVAVPEAQQDVLFWENADKRGTRSLYLAYLNKFPAGSFVDLAKEKLRLFGHGDILIRSNVFGDQVTINGKSYGSSELTASLDAGDYLIEVEKPGYIAVQKRVKIRQGDSQQLDVILRPEYIPPEEFNSSKDAILMVKRPDRELTPKARTESTIGMEFVKIPAGCFEMGSPIGEEGKLDNENQHEVCLTGDFWMSKYEVTQEQWREVMGHNPSFFTGCGKNCPVERVSWVEVQQFIQRLNRKTGENYRLPTEAEWEYAARAGSTEATYAGDLEIYGANDVPGLDRIAWYSGNSGAKYRGAKYCGDWDQKQREADRCGTKPVGEKKPNRWGLHDMLGNVWEWTQDWYGYSSFDSQIDPVGPGKGTLKLVKGGHWAGSLDHARAAARYGFETYAMDERVGFRLVR